MVVYLLLMGGSLRNKRDLNKVTMSDKLNNLRSLLDDRKFTQLSMAAKNLLELNPGNVEIMELLAYGLQQQGRFREAVEVCTRACKVESNSWMINFVAGICLKSLSDYKGAIKFLIRAANISPNDTQTAKVLLESEAAAGNIAEGFKRYLSHCKNLGKNKNKILTAPIKSVRNWALEVGLELKDAGEPEYIPYIDPNIQGQKTKPFTTSVKTEQPYIVEISNATIFSQSSLLLTSDLNILSDVAGHPRFGRYVSLAYEAIATTLSPELVAIDYDDYRELEISEGVWMSGLASNSFGHWLPEFLPKLQFYQRHSGFKSMTIIVDEDMPPSHLQHLRRLVENEIFFLPKKTSLRCKKLLVASLPTFYPVELNSNSIPHWEIGALSPRALKFVRGEIDPVPLASRRIFLSRKSMKWRRLLNEEEISVSLIEFGFEIICLEELDVYSQIRLMQEAEWIVAPNGSALLNLIFAHKDVNVLILSQSNLFNWGNFQGPMNALGYRPTFLVDLDSTELNSKHADYSIPVTLIKKTLIEMGLKQE